MNGHGGNVYKAARELGMEPSQIADFSASINPLGMPGSVADAIRDGLAMLRHYPDLEAADLALAIAKTIDIEPEMILCGNGSTELIYLLTRTLKPSRVLIPAPTFTEYARAVMLNGRGRRGERNEPAIEYLKLDAAGGFRLDPDAFAAGMKNKDIAFLCNPNNPTGGLVARRDLLHMAEAARRHECFLVVDEAFIDFAAEESVVDAVPKNPFLIVLRSLTKFYALPGLRIGYGVVPRGVIRMLRNHQEPWSVNSLAQTAGIAALQDESYRRSTLRTIRKEKETLEDGFSLIKIAWFPSAANFYLLKTERAEEISGTLRRKGILVRGCGNFMGLDESYIRVAVRTRRENMRLLKELANLCAV